MKKVIAIVMTIIMVLACTSAVAKPLNTREQMVTIFNNGIKAAPLPGTDMVCVFLEETNAFAVTVESDTMMNAAVNAGTGKNTSDWEAIKASIYNLYTSYRNLADTFGHTDVGLYFMLRAENAGEAFAYYMLGGDAGQECWVSDPITGDKLPVTAK